LLQRFLGLWLLPRHSLKGLSTEAILEWKRCMRGYSLQIWQSLHVNEAVQKLLFLPWPTLTELHQPTKKTQFGKSGKWCTGWECGPGFTPTWVS
jgi:hypothetical protein